MGSLRHISLKLFSPDNFTIAKGAPGQVWYMLSRWAAWMCIGLTFAAGISVGFAIAALLLV